MTLAHSSPPSEVVSQPVAVDCQHATVAYAPCEIAHRYGKNVHILRDPLALAMLGPGLHERRVSAAVAGLGLWLEHTLQLLINTLSFARVGAFALAHAGLSSAVVMLATGTAWWAQILILIAGNLLILTLEALVVLIQTTRLLLFEFFTRFLSGSGRPFLPLPLPPSARPAT